MIWQLKWLKSKHLLSKLKTIKAKIQARRSEKNYKKTTKLYLKKAKEYGVDVCYHCGENSNHVRREFFQHMRLWFMNQNLTLCYKCLIGLMNDINKKINTQEEIREKRKKNRLKIVVDKENKNNLK